LRSVYFKNITRYSFNDLLLYLTPILGIIVFTFVMTFFRNDLLEERLPYFQGVSSFFSVSIIALQYNFKRDSISGRFIFFYFGLVIFSILFFYYNSDIKQFNYIISLSLLFSSSSALSIYKLYKNEDQGFLLVLLFNSIFIPLTLLVPNIILNFFALALIIFVFKLWSNRYEKPTDMNYFDILVSMLNSFFIHLPFLLFPVFEYRIQSLIKSDLYINYVITYKWVNGLIVFLFSKIQFDILVHKQSSQKSIVKYAYIILPVIFIFSFSKNIYALILVVMLLSIGINIISIEARKEIFSSKVNYPYIICSIMAFAGYTIFILFFSNLIQIYPYIFTFWIYSSICLPFILNKIFNSYKILNKSL
jgi:hypothetical protein